MANDMMSTLKGLLGDNADEKIQSVLSALQSTNQTPKEETAETTAAPAETPGPAPAKPMKTSGTNGMEGMEYIMKIKNVIDEMGSANDARSNLLLSLRPYMRQERQRGIDNAIRVLNLSKFSGLFKL